MIPKPNTKCDYEWNPVTHFRSTELEARVLCVHGFIIGNNNNKVSSYLYFANIIIFG